MSHCRSVHESTRVRSWPPPVAMHGTYVHSTVQYCLHSIYCTVYDRFTKPTRPLLYNTNAGTTPPHCRSTSPPVTVDHHRCLLFTRLLFISLSSDPLDCSCFSRLIAVIFELASSPRKRHQPSPPTVDLSKMEFERLMELAAQQTRASQAALAKETHIRQAREQSKRLEEERKEKERIRFVRFAIYFIHTPNL